MTVTQYWYQNDLLESGGGIKTRINGLYSVGRPRATIVMRLWLLYAPHVSTSICHEALPAAQTATVLLV